MNKFIKLGKRILALFIVVLLNVNTYAAVGANDGSAFVTKAEFDALVNTFNEQMDAYQSGLNSKIDGAIANYLAGLSSQQTSEVPFYDGVGSKAFVLNFDTLTDMVITRAVLNISMSSNMISSGSDRSSTSGTINLIRDDNSAKHGECFIVKDGMIHVGGNEVRIKLTYTSDYKDFRSWSSYTYNKDAINLRMRGGSVAINNSITRSCDGRWVGFYGTSLNYTDRYDGGTGTVATKYTHEVSVEQVDTVRVLFDNSRKNDNRVFVDYENDGNYDNVYGYDWYNDTANYYLNYAKDDAGKDSHAVYKLPSDAKITTQGNVVLMGSLASGTSKLVSNVNWVDKGSWNSETADTGYEEYYKWYEPVLKLQQKDAGSILQQSYTDDLLKKYNPKYSDADRTNNWRGYLTQGIPVCRFDDNGKATFELDTTSLGGEVGAASVIAFSTKAFERTAVLDTFARDEKITAIKVDNNTVTGGSVSLTPGKHEFEIHMTPASGGDTLFMKVAYPSSVTTSIRNVFTLPKTVMLSIG